MNTTDLGIELERFDFEYLLERALSKVPPDIDTREGSIIFDALSPACHELAMVYMELKLMYQATFIHTAFDNYLDLRVAERGLMRFPATRAIRLGYFEDTEGNPMSVPVGARFSTIDIADVVNFAVLDNYDAPGYYRMECEIEGVIGNAYVGDLLPITHINGLATATLSELLTPGQDMETDESLRTRFFNSLEVTAFGGNIAQYKEQLLSIDGVGAAQVHPIWNGGGTVLCSLVDSEFNPVSQNFIDNVQVIIDPRLEGQGLGIAPIGHQVTITTPAVVEVDVNVFVDLTPGTTVGQVQGQITDAINNHFATLRSQWSNGNEFAEYFLSLFRSQIMVAVLGVENVLNVRQVLLNGMDDDITFEQSGNLQELPFAGTVVVSV